ncbi:hypothetical protein [Superficieibacter sp. 1612_C1]|uniref:hypothetical protein n=1 Tax=Superficieibacter sp. 1612_C1 TaxID=2780382 RepID=UPI00188346F4|nr:hypothetical protein [Superficieibacter sp. 1612_C1]
MTTSHSRVGKRNRVKQGWGMALAPVALHARRRCACAGLRSGYGADAGRYLPGGAALARAYGRGMALTRGVTCPAALRLRGLTVGIWR